MKVDIYRKVETSESITGEFWLDGVRQCYAWSHRASHRTIRGIPAFRQVSSALY